jgi:hypothetical protein
MVWVNIVAQMLNVVQKLVVLKYKNEDLNYLLNNFFYHKIVILKPTIQGKRAITDGNNIHFGRFEIYYFIQKIYFLFIFCFKVTAPN